MLETDIFTPHAANDATEAQALARAYDQTSAWMVLAGLLFVVGVACGVGLAALVHYGATGRWSW